MRFALALAFFAVAAAAQIPKFEPDPSWPKPLPNNWMLGQVSGTSVDSHDHMWVIHRPRTLDEHDDTARPAKAIAAFPRLP